MQQLLSGVGCWKHARANFNAFTQTVAFKNKMLEVSGQSACFFKRRQGKNSEKDRARSSAVNQVQKPRFHFLAWSFAEIGRERGGFDYRQKAENEHFD